MPFLATRRHQASSNEDPTRSFVERASALFDRYGIGFRAPPGSSIEVAPADESDVQAMIIHIVGDCGVAGPADTHCLMRIFRIYGPNALERVRRFAKEMAELCRTTGLSFYSPGGIQNLDVVRMTRLEIRELYEMILGEAPPRSFYPGGPLHRH